MAVSYRRRNILFLLLMLFFFSKGSIWGDVDILFEEDFEDETVAVYDDNTTALTSPIPWIPDGSGSPDWDNDVFNPDSMTIDEFQVDNTNIGGNSSKKFFISISSAGTATLMGAGFSPSTERYVTVEYDVYLTSKPPVNPSGEIYYSDSTANLDSTTPRIAIHLQFSDKNGVTDSHSGDDDFIYSTTGQDGDVTTDEGEEVRVLTNLNEENSDTTGEVPDAGWAVNTWYRVQVVADQDAKTFDLRVTNLSTTTSYTQTGIPFNDTNAGYIRKMWFGVTASAPDAYFDNIKIYQDTTAPPVNGPNIVINDTTVGPVSVAGTGMDIDFTDDVDLQLLEYRIGSLGSWTPLEDGSGNLYTSGDLLSGGTDTAVTATDLFLDFAALAQGNNTIYIRGTDSDDNVTTSAATVTYIKDTEIPDTAIISIPSASITATPLTSIQGTVSDAVAGIAANAAQIVLFRDIDGDGVFDSGDGDVYWDGTNFAAGIANWRSTVHAAALGGESITFSNSESIPVTDGWQISMQVRVSDTLAQQKVGVVQTFLVAIGSPGVTVNTATVGPTKDNPDLDVTFTDETDLVSVEYSIGGAPGGGGWVPLTTDGTTAYGDVDLTTNETGPFYMVAADGDATVDSWDDMAQGATPIYFRAYDGGNYTISASPLTAQRDTVAPTINFTTPGSDPFGDLPTIAGTIADATNGYGFTANSLTFDVFHDIDGDGVFDSVDGDRYWGGTAFDQTTVQNLGTNHSGTTDDTPVSWTKNAVIPAESDLIPNNKYSFIAAITDRAGNNGLTTVTYTFNTDSYTWTGASSTNWDAPGNWDRSAVPPDNGTATITIPAGLSNYPLLSSSIDIASLSVAAGAEVDIAGQAVAIATVSNEGTIRAQGGESVTITTWDTDSGTVHYNGNTNTTGLVLGNAYYHLLLENTVDAGAVTWTLDAPLSVTGDLVVANYNTLNADGNNITLGGDFSISGSFSPGATPGAQTLTLTGASGAGPFTLSSGLALNSLTLNGLGKSFSLAGDITVNKDVTFTQGVLQGNGNAITLKGNWTNNVGTSAYVPGTGGTVELTDSGLASVFTGDTQFYNLNSTAAGKTLTFTAGTTQTILAGGDLSFNGIAGSLITLQSSGASAWNLAYAGASYGVSYANISWGNVSSGGPLTASFSADGGNNTNWAFSALRTWTGAGPNTNWGHPQNWVGNIAPTATDDAAVPGSLAKYPRLAGGIALNSLDLQSGASVDMNGNDFTITGGVIIAGTVIGATESIITGGNALISSGAVIPSGITLEMTGAARQLSSAVNLGNLTIAGTGSVTLQSDITLSGNLTLETGSVLNLNGYTLNIGGNLLLDGTLNAGSGTLSVTGALTDTADGGVLNGNSGTVTVAGDFSPGTYSATSGITTISSDWNPGSFTHNSGTVIFASTGASVISGSHTFHNLSCTVPGKTLTFTAGTTQSIAAGGTLTLEGASGAGNNLTLQSSAAAVWNLSYGGAAYSARYVALSYSNVSAGGPLDAFFSTDNLNNAGWNFTGTIKTWQTGNGSTSWNTASNWDPSGVPGAADAVTIPAGGTQPILDVAGTVIDLTIESGASLDLAGFDLSLTGVLSHEGTLRLEGTESVTLAGGMDTDSGLVVYDGAGATGLVLGSSYHDLEFAGSGTYTLGADLVVSGNLTITSGTLGGGGRSITVAGSWVNVPGAAGYSAGTGGTVVFAGAADTVSITGDTTFYNLRCEVPGKTLQFAAGSTQTVSAGGVLIARGASGSLLHLASTTPGSRWSLQYNGGTGYIAEYLDISDSDLLGNNIDPSNSFEGTGNDANGGGTDPPSWWTITIDNVTWLGTADSSWSNSANWQGGSPPGPGDNVTIQAGTFFPVLETNVSLGNLTIEAGAALRTAGYSVNHSGTYANNGTLYRWTDIPFSGADTDSGTVVFEGFSASSAVPAGTYFNLSIQALNGTDSFSSAGAITVNGDLEVSAGTFNPGTQSVAVTGNVQVSGGTLALGTGSFTGAALTIASGTLTQTGNNGANTQSATSLTVSGGSATWDTGSDGGSLTFAGPVNHTGGSLSFGAKTVTGISNFTVTDPDGNCSLNSASLSVSGNLSLSTAGAGSFVQGTSLVTLTGTCALTSGGNELYDLTIGGTGAVTPQDTLTVNRNFTIDDGVGTSYIHNSRSLVLGGTGGVAGNITDSNTGANPLENLGAVTINTAAKTMTTGISAASLTVASTLNTGGLNLTVTGAVDATGGTLDLGSGGTVTVGGNLTLGTLANAAGSTLVLNGAGAQAVTPNGQSFGTVSATGTGGVTLTGTALFTSLSVAAGETFTLGGGAAASLTLSGTGANVLQTGASGGFRWDASTNTSALLFTGAAPEMNNGSAAGMQVTSGTAGASMSSTNPVNLLANPLELNGQDLSLGGFSTAVAHTLGAGETLTLTGAAAFNGGLTLNGDGDTLTVVGTSSLTASGLTVTVGSVSTSTGSVDLGAGTLDIAAGGSILSTDASSLSAGAVTNAGTITFDTAGAASWTVSGDLTSTGTITNTVANTVSVGGNLAISGTFDGTLTNSTITVNGAASTINCGVQIGNLVTAATATGASLTGSALSLAGTLTLDASSALSTGTLGLTVAGASTINGTLNGGSSTHSFASLSGTGTLNASSGSTTISGGMSGITFTHNNGTVTLTGGTVAAYTFYDLELAGNVTASGNWTVDRNWTYTSGTFTPGTNTVILGTTNTALISGSTTFNNLSCTTPGKTIQFTDGTTQTVSGTFTINGTNTPGNLITLEGTGTAGWAIDAAGAAVSAAAVEYSTASTAITAASSWNKGNNTGWTFSATTLTWNGSADAVWTNTANWDLGYYPNTTDNAVINTTGTEPILAAPLSLVSLTINAGKTLSLNSQDLTLTGNLSSAGTLIAAATEQITVSGNVDFSAAGDNFTEASSTLNLIGEASSFNGGNDTLYNLIINKDTAGTVLTSAGEMQVTGTLSLTRGTWAAGTLTHQIAGGWNSSAADFTFTPETSTIRLTTADSGIRLKTGQSFNNLTIDNGAVMNALGTDLSVTGTLVLTAGTLDLNTRNLTVTGTADINGTLDASGNGNLSFGGTVDFTGGAFTAGTGTMSFTNAAAQTLTAPGTTLGTAQLSGAATNLTLAGDAVFGALTIAAGRTLTTGDYSLTASSISLEGTVDATALTSAKLFSVTGSITGTAGVLNGRTGASPGNIDINGNVSLATYSATAGTTYIGGNLDITTLTHNSGTVVLDTTADATIAANNQIFNILQISANKTMTEALQTAGNLIIDDGFTLTGGNNSLYVDGNLSDTTAPGTGTLLLGTQPLTVTGNTAMGTLTGSSGTIDINGNVNITDLTASSVTTNIGGNYSVGTLAPNTGLMVFDGTSGSTVIGEAFYQVRIDTNTTMTGAWTVADTLEIAAGVLTTGSNSLAVTGNLSGAGTLTASDALVDVIGSLTVNTYNATSANTEVGVDFNVATFTPGTGTVVLNTASPADLHGNTFYNLEIDKGAGNTVTSLTAEIVVTNQLLLSSGIWNAGTFTHQIAGNWNSTGITFNEDTSTITLTGGAPQITTGGLADTFNNLTISGGAAAALTPIGITGNLTIADTRSLSLSTHALEVGGNTLLNGSASLSATSGPITLTGDLTGGTSSAFTAGSGIVDIDGDVTGITSFTESSNTTSIAGTVVTFSTFTKNGGTLILDGTGTPVVLTTNGQHFNNLTINTGGGPETVRTSGALYVDGNLSLASGHTLDLSTNNSIMTITGTTANAGTISGGSSLLTFTGAVSGAGTITSGTGGVTFAGDYTGGSLNGNSTGILTFQGASVTLDSFTHNSGTVVLNRDGAQALTTNNQPFNNLTVFNAGTDTTTITGALTLDGNLAVQTGQTLNLSTNNSPMSITGTTTNSGTISGGSSLLTFTGGVSGVGTINSGTGGITFAGTYAGGTLNGSTAGVLTFQGNTSLGTLAPASSTVTFSGTANPQTLDTNGQALPSVTISKGAVGNTLRIITSDVTQTGGASLTMTAGTLDLATDTRSWTLQAGLTVGTNTILAVGTGSLLGGQSLTVSGTGVLTHSTGTLTLSSLTHSSTGASSLGTGTVGISGTLEVSAGTVTQTGTGASQASGAISVTGGTLSWDAGNLTLSGPIEATAGTLALGGKTVTGVTTFSVTGSGSVDLGSSQTTATSHVTVDTTGTVTPGTSLISMTGGPSNLDIGTTGLNNLTLNADVTLTGAGAVTDVNTLTVSSGSLAVGANTFQAASAGVSALVTVAAGGAFSTSAGLTVNGGGSVDAAGTGTITAGNVLTVNGTGSLSVVDGNLTVTTGGMALNGSGTISSTGTGNVTISGGGVSWGAGASSAISLSGTGALGITGDFTQTAANNGPVTVGAGGMTVSGTVTNHDTIQVTGGNLSFTGAGPHTNAGTIETVTSGTQSYDGAVTNTGTISGVGLVSFNGGISGAGTVNVGTGGATAAAASDYTGGTLNIAGNSYTQSGGNLTLGTLSNPANSTVLFTAEADQSCEMGTNSFYNLTKSGTGTLTLTASDGQIDITNNLSISGDETTEVDVAGINFDIENLLFTESGDVGQIENNPLFSLTGEQTANRIGSLDQSAGSLRYYGSGGTIFSTNIGGTASAYMLIVDGTNLSSTFSLENDTIIIKTIDIRNGSFNLAGYNLSLGDGPPSRLYIADGTSLSINDGQLIIDGDIVIEGSFSIGNAYVKLSGRWLNSGAFDSGTGTVEFYDPPNGGGYTRRVSAIGGIRDINDADSDGITDEVLGGSNSFYNLTIATPGKTVWIQHHGSDISYDETAKELVSSPQVIQRIKTGGKFTVQGSDPGTTDAVPNSYNDSLVRLLSTWTLSDDAIFDYTFNNPGGLEPLLDSAVPSPTGDGETRGVHPDSSLTDLGDIARLKKQQWAFEIEFGAEPVDITWLYLELGYAVRPVIPESIFYHPENRNWTWNWRNIIPVWRSYTLDTNGDGKLDRIGVVVGEFEGDPIELFFSSSWDDNLTVEVDGYTVTGYAPARDVPVELGTFYIELEQKPFLDTDATPVWRIPDGGNTSLTATTASGARFVATIDGEGQQQDQNPDDYAHPVMAYSLTSPGRNELFLRFSEPVFQQDGTPLEAADFHLGTTGNPVPTAIRTPEEGLADEEFLLTFADPLTATQIGGESHLVVDSVLQDAGETTASFSRNNRLRWNSYTESEWLAGNEDTTDFPDLATSHRVSDIGIGLAEPVWARNSLLDRDALRGAGIGLINSFDGTEWLQPEDLELQTKVTITSPDLGAPDMLYLNSAPEAFLSADNPAFWLPWFDEVTFSGLVPFPNSTAAQLPAQGYTPIPAEITTGADDGNNLFLHEIDGASSFVGDGRTIQFLLQTGPAESPFYHARLTRPTAPDWYRSLAPWSFGLKDILEQTGNVTILNNVINPDRGETTTLYYTPGRTGTVTIQVFNLAGDLVDLLYRGRRNGGQQYATSWDGRNRAGFAVGRGIYFVRFTGPGIDEYRKVMVIR